MDFGLVVLGVLIVAWVAADVWSSTGPAFLGAVATALIGGLVAWVRRANRLSNDEKVRLAAERAAELLAAKLNPLDARVTETTMQLQELQALVHETLVVGTKVAQDNREVIEKEVLPRLLDLGERVAELSGLVRGIMRPDLDRPRRPPDPLTPEIPHEH